MTAASCAHWPSASSRSIAARSPAGRATGPTTSRSEEHTSELQSQSNLVCRLLLEKKKKIPNVTGPTSKAPTTIGVSLPYHRLTHHNRRTHPNHLSLRFVQIQAVMPELQSTIILHV